MARRKRFYRNRVNPDRGWIVGTEERAYAFSGATGDTLNFVETLFDFADIDPEALTGRIEQDKSDWFIKRVIFNCSAWAQIDGIGELDFARWFQWGIGTMGNANASDMLAFNFDVFGPEAYNLWSRLFQTGVSPAYHPATIPFAADAATPSAFRLWTTSDDGATPAGYLGTAPWWGPAHIKEDFTVSNAGLRNNQICALIFSLAQGPIGFNWNGADTLQVRYWYQVLVQKRRT